MIPTLNPATAGAGLPLAEFASLASSAGFPGIEINAGEVAQLVKQSSVQAVREILESRGVIPACCGFPVDFRAPNPEDWKQSLAAVPELIAAAAAVGCRRCVTWIMPKSYTDFSETWRFHVERLKPGVALLKEHGIAFGIEFVAPKTMRTGPYDFIWNLDQALSLAQEVGGDGVLLDSFHWFCAGHTTDDIARLRPEQIVQVHINDAPNVPRDEQMDQVRLLPGRGIIDLTDFLAALMGIGYEGPVSVEVFDEDLKKMPADEAASKAYAAVSSVLSKVAIEL